MTEAHPPRPPGRGGAATAVPLDRRAFLRVAGGTGLAGILASGRAPAHAQGQRLHIVRWVDFVPAADEVLRTKLVPEANKALGAEIILETINANDIQPRITAAISSGGGADVFQLLHNWPHLYERSLVDVGDVCDRIARAQGGFYQTMEVLARVGGTWRAVPHAIVGGQIAYRRSLFAEVGYPEFPRTWDQYLEAGRKLKARGHPIGQTAGHTFGDAPSFWYPVMWAWGGKELEADGKTVAIRSKPTVDSVRFLVAFWKDACDEGGLAWDDSNNNRAFLSGTIAATINGASIYVESLRNREKYRTEKGAPMHTDIAHAPSPAGPAGQFHYHTSFHHGVMSYSKNQKLAKEFLAWLHAREQFEKWFAVQRGFSVGATTEWETHRMWEQDPVMLPYRTAARAFRVFGYAGPPSAKASEVYSRYIVVDMYAKAIQGMSAEDAVKWAEAELRKIHA